MKWKLMTAILVITGFLMIGPMASAASLNFTAHDATDVTDGDFDITNFGATENGNTVTFWMQVRGNINDHPQDGYINGYEISIEGVDMVAAWINSSGHTTPLIYVSTESGGTSFLSPGQYVISGGRLDFHIDSSYFSSIGENYTVDVYTGHVQGSNPYISSHLDEATYSHYGSGGGSSNTSSSGFPMDLLLWILIIIIILVVVIVLVVLLVVHKSTPPSQPPQQPPQPPSQPPWEE